MFGLKTPSQGLIGRGEGSSLDCLLLLVLPSLFNPNDRVSPLVRRVFGGAGLVRLNPSMGIAASSGLDLWRAIKDELVGVAFCSVLPSGAEEEAFKSGLSGSLFVFLRGLLMKEEEWSGVPGGETRCSGIENERGKISSSGSAPSSVPVPVRTFEPRELLDEPLDAEFERPLEGTSSVSLSPLLGGGVGKVLFAYFAVGDSGGSAELLLLGVMAVSSPTRSSLDT